MIDLEQADDGSWYVTVSANLPGRKKNTQIVLTTQMYGRNKKDKTKTPRKDVGLDAVRDVYELCQAIAALPLNKVARDKRKRDNLGKFLPIDYPKKRKPKSV